MKVQARRQALADAQALGVMHGITSRDESLLALLSAPVSNGDLTAVLHGKSGKALQTRELRNLDKYIKRSVDSFTKPEREKLESLDHDQLMQLKSSIVRQKFHMCVYGTFFIAMQYPLTFHMCICPTGTGWCRICCRGVHKREG